MRTRDHEEIAPFVNLADITEIELVILTRLREVTMGEHRSRSRGSGFDFTGLRGWQAGDRLASIDWAQSSLTGFSPLIIREFEQPSTATVIAIADLSPSTRCGVQGVPIAAAIARAIATIGMSSVFFQDPFGLVTFDGGFLHLAALRPLTGKSHVVHCLDAYQYQRGLQSVRRSGSISTSLGGFVRRQTMLPVVSDFLFDDAGAVLKELSLLNGTHDVFIVLIDSAFAFDLPGVSAGWVEIADVETGRACTISRRAYEDLAGRARRWQQDVRRTAKDLALDVVTIDLDHTRSDIALGEFVVERRLRKTKN
ncbi:MAG: hypothetical protein DMF96_16015 [Acidobacteria bacterium]|nr:MAG: hypothetical protein DMF96_16015 [Acidobacteriota bacterium]